MAVEKQNTYGWMVAADLFLGGAGAGLFFISFIMNILNKYEALSRIGAVSGPVLVLIGTIVLFFDLSTKSRLYRLFRNPSSWMTRGTYFITFFIILGLAYSLPAFRLFTWIPWSKATSVGEIIGATAAILSILTMLYTGFLFGAIKRIPLWNTPVLPLLFFFSSLYTGMAIILLIAPLFVATPVEDFNALVMIEIVLILVQLLVLGIFLLAGSYGSTTAMESIRLLKRPSFIIGVIIVGLIVPLALLLSYYGVATGIFALLILGSIPLLIGGFFLRYYILRAGARLPLYPF